jgi:hypothetical protein
MTEAEWLACTDPTPMLEFLRGRASDRKLRLFAVGCCRRVWPQMTEGASRRAVEMAERLADGGAEKDRSALRKAARKASNNAVRNDARAAGRAAAGVVERKIEPFVESIRHNAAVACAWVAARRADPKYTEPTKGDEAYEAALPHEGSLQCHLLRCIMGNPFRPVALDTAWLMPAVVNLTQAIYQDRAFDHLPVLADALEEAGCVNADLLTHCRGPGPHVRGCWVVDAVLGKT